MYRDYKTKDGTILHTWYNNLGRVNVLDDKGLEVAEYEFDKGEDPVFCHNNELIHINDFLCYPLDEIIDRLDLAAKAGDRWYVTDNQILATFLKEADKIGVEMEVSAFDMIIPELGFGIKSDKRVKTIMVPTEDGYSKDYWHYKIRFAPANKELEPVVGTEALYFSDLCSLLVSGKAKLVNLNTI